MRTSKWRVVAWLVVYVSCSVVFVVVAVVFSWFLLLLFLLLKIGRLNSEHENDSKDKEPENSLFGQVCCLISHLCWHTSNVVLRGSGYVVSG